MRVFVAYRRDDNQWVAGRLRDRLADTYESSNVFFDVDDIPLGADFRDVIRSTLREVDVVLAVIGVGWSAERLSSETDFVRAELHEALLQKKRLIPVLVGDTRMPTAEALPPELESLAYLNALRLRPDPDFASDAARLIAGIGPDQPASPVEGGDGRRGDSATAAQPIRATNGTDEFEGPSDEVLCQLVTRIDEGDEEFLTVVRGTGPDATFIQTTTVGDHDGGDRWVVERHDPSVDERLRTTLPDRESVQRVIVAWVHDPEASVELGPWEPFDL